MLCIAEPLGLRDRERDCGKKGEKKKPGAQGLGVRGGERKGKREEILAKMSVFSKLHFPYQ